MSPPPTILIADDHPSVCTGLKTMVEPQFAVVAFAHHGDDVLGLVERHRPDVVLMDLSLPGRHGVALTRELKARPGGPRVVVVTMHAERTYVEEALRAGADGYVLKTARASELRTAIAAALEGRHHVMAELEAAPATPDGGELLQGELALVASLHRRQQEVLYHLGRGRTQAEIAAELGLTEKTVEYHRQQIRRRLGITSPAGLYHLASLYAALRSRAR